MLRRIFGPNRNEKKQEDGKSFKRRTSYFFLFILTVNSCWEEAVVLMGKMRNVQTYVTVKVCNHTRSYTLLFNV
jgi:hypothetical protein